MRRRVESEAGFSVVLAVASILALLLLGLALVTVVTEDSDLSVSHVRSDQAYYAAQAGIEYAVRKLASDPSWAGLPRPGKTVGMGSFWVARPDTVDEKGARLSSGQMRIVATGVVGSSTRAIQVHVASGGIATAAGTGARGNAGDGGDATAATIAAPEGAAVSPNGDLYVCDPPSHVVRRISAATGTIATVAGSGLAGYSGDGGAATFARLRAPEDMAVASNGDLYIADTGNHVIRKVTAATGVIRTVAGTGVPGFSGDGGPAIVARLRSPRGIQVAPNGDLYVGDRGNDRIRRVVAASGTIETYAGSGAPGYSGDGGAAIAARLRAPQGLCLSSTGDLYVADAGNNAVRRISPAGVITTVAGTGIAGYAGDGSLAAAARLNGPRAVERAPSGDLYVADTGNDVVRRVEAGSLRISTIAGNGTAGFGGDGGSATAASLHSPRGIAVAPSGAYYVSDAGNQRIRRVAGCLAVTAWIEARR
ncbi:MAG: hypothetical protein ACM3PF_04805 [Bacteroidota bacterium]